MISSLSNFVRDHKTTVGMSFIGAGLGVGASYALAQSAVPFSAALALTPWAVAIIRSGFEAFLNNDPTRASKAMGKLAAATVLCTSLAVGLAFSGVVAGITFAPVAFLASAPAYAPAFPVWFAICTVVNILANRVEYGELPEIAVELPPINPTEI